MNKKNFEDSLLCLLITFFISALIGAFMGNDIIFGVSAVGGIIAFIVCFLITI